MTRLKTGLIASGIAVLAGGLLLAAPMLAVAHGFGGRSGGPAGHFMRGHMIDHIGEELDLTDDQRTEIEAIFERAHAQVHDRRGELREAHDQGKALILADSYDAAEVEAFADAQAAKVAEMIVLGAQTIHEAKAILTPEQQEKFAELAESHGGKHGRHGHRRHGHNGWHDGSDE